MPALLNCLSGEAPNAFWKSLLDGLLASNKVSYSKKEKLKGFGSITSIETEVEHEEFGHCALH